MGTCAALAQLLRGDFAASAKVCGCIRHHKNKHNCLLVIKVFDFILPSNLLPNIGVGHLSSAQTSQEQIDRMSEEHIQAVEAGGLHAAAHAQSSSQVTFMT
jgi:hypothetical protein